MNKAIIVAYDKNRAIGSQGDMPWGRSLLADLAHFKQLTTGKCVIMGHNTFHAIGARPLPNRENIVISSKPTGVKGVLTALDLPSALALSRYDTYIIGGGHIYNEALQHSDITTIYATEINASFPHADTFFPEIHLTEWHEVSRAHHPADEHNAYAFDFVEYRRTTPKPES